MKIDYPHLVDLALAVAAAAHASQNRKDKTRTTPYIAHPSMVGYLLRDAGFDDEVVAAGILHDTVEDTTVSVADIERDFGARVSVLVSAVTEHDKSLPWETRKAQYLDHLAETSIDALAIAAADKLHNTRSILGAMDRLHAAGDDPEGVWSSFKRGKQASVGFLRKANLRIAQRAGEDARLRRLNDALSLALDELEAG